MIENYMIEKFVERANVLKYGFGYKLEMEEEKVLKFLICLCKLPFKNKLYFNILMIKNDDIFVEGIINDIKLPFRVSFSLLNSKKIPYRLSSWIYSLEVELANKINNIHENVEMLDLYDIYMYFTFRRNEIDSDILSSFLDKSLYNKINKIICDDSLRKKWEKFDSTIKISFDNILEVLENIVSLSEKVLV